MPLVQFKPGPTVGAMMRSSARVRGIRGPIGSGKSAGCLWNMMQLIHAQRPGPDGVRRSRWAVIRNSYRELADTTRRSFWDWFPPESVGEFIAGDNVQIVQREDVHAEILFRSLDRPGDVRKLLSLELTGGFVNEARELPLEVIQMLEGRVGRYPSVRQGGASWYGILMDTNPPDVSHWWPEMFEQIRPEGWQQFVQPSGLSLEAENVANLPANYYRAMLPGKSAEWIRVYVEGQYGYLADGRAVYPEFQAAVHAVPSLEWHGGPVVVGMDFGLTPAAAIGQVNPGGGMDVLRELVTTDTGAVRFGEQLKAILATEFAGKVAGMWGDPAGDIRAGTDEQTVFDVLRAVGLIVQPAPSQDPLLRREAVGAMLRRLGMTGAPALRIHPGNCPVLAKGMAGHFKYRRMQVGGLEARYEDKPEKNRYSHVCEALEYLALGVGEGRALLRPQTDARQQRRRAVGVI